MPHIAVIRDHRGKDMPNIECKCEYDFTCRHCLRNAKPWHFTPSSVAEQITEKDMSKKTLDYWPAGTQQRDYEHIPVYRRDGHETRLSVEECTLDAKPHDCTPVIHSRNEQHQRENSSG